MQKFALLHPLEQAVKFPVGDKGSVLLQSRHTLSTVICGDPVKGVGHALPNLQRLKRMPDAHLLRKDLFHRCCASIGELGLNVTKGHKNEVVVCIEVGC
eukprot:461527-Rhodomonas_salina.1